MTRYLLSVGYRAGATPPSPDELQEIMADVGDVRRRMQAEGSWVFGGGLHDPSTASVVTAHDGSAVTTDGPFIDSKEVIGGITIIDVADLDAALGWAERTARATRCPIEVRPFMDDHPE
ncbi:MAG: YciI family protein [Acidimicrobiales bacterium]